MRLYAAVSIHLEHFDNPSAFRTMGILGKMPLETDLYES